MYFIFWTEIQWRYLPCKYRGKCTQSVNLWCCVISRVFPEISALDLFFCFWEQIQMYVSDLGCDFTTDSRIIDSHRFWQVVGSNCRFLWFFSCDNQTQLEICCSENLHVNKSIFLKVKYVFVQCFLWNQFPCDVRITWKASIHLFHCMSKYKWNSPEEDQHMGPLFTTVQYLRMVSGMETEFIFSFFCRMFCGNKIISTSACT